MKENEIRQENKSSSAARLGVRGQKAASFKCGRPGNLATEMLQPDFRQSGLIAAKARPESFSDHPHLSFSRIGAIILPAGSIKIANKKVISRRADRGSPRRLQRETKA
jgi:hypothetical protein